MKPNHLTTLILFFFVEQNLIQRNVLIQHEIVDKTIDRNVLPGQFTFGSTLLYLLHDFNINRMVDIKSHEFVYFHENYFDSGAVEESMINNISMGYNGHKSILYLDVIICSIKRCEPKSII